MASWPLLASRACEAVSATSTAVCLAKPRHLRLQLNNAEGTKLSCFGKLSLCVGFFVCHTLKNTATSKQRKPFSLLLDLTAKHTHAMEGAGGMLLDALSGLWGRNVWFILGAGFSSLVMLTGHVKRKLLLDQAKQLAVRSPIPCLFSLSRTHTHTHAHTVRNHTHTHCALPYARMHNHKQIDDTIRMCFDYSPCTRGRYPAS